MASKSTSLYGWCFLLAGMSSASGGGFAAILFLGADHLFSHCQQLRLRYGRVIFPARHTGLSAVNHAEKARPVLGRAFVRDYFPVLLSALPVDVPKEE